MNRCVARAASGAFAAANGTGSFFSMIGATNKTIAIHRLYIESPTMASPGFLNILVKKVSTAPTGGTATTLSNVVVDSSCDDTAIAVVKVYTAAPTSGTSIGNIASARVFSHKATPNSDGLFTSMELFHADEMEDYIVLRDATEGIEAYFESSPGGAVTMMIRVEWVEE